MSRALRRHHRSRLIQNFTRRQRHQADQDPTWLEMHVRRLVNTRTLCSCGLCGNARRQYGNSERALTRAEVRVRDWRKFIDKDEIV